jgi:manganese/iron transport system permease protein
MSWLAYGFIQRSLIACVLAGVSCSLIGVPIVVMDLSFIGVCMSHAALAGAVAGLFFGFSPTLGAYAGCAVTAILIGPIADRTRLGSGATMGVVFAALLGVTFLLMGLLEGPKTHALRILWGSLLTVQNTDLIVMGVITVIVMASAILFVPYLRALMLGRELAEALGAPSTSTYYGVILLCGLTTACFLAGIGGLLLFCLILTPAASAYQFTYRLGVMLLVAPLIGVTAAVGGLAVSVFADWPTGATIILLSCVIFAASTLVSTKRGHKSYA